MNDNNYKITVNNLHDDGWKFFYFTYYDINMFGHGCGVSQYPQLYDQQPEKYQLLPHPYLGVYGEKTTKEKWMLELAGESEKMSGSVLKKW